MTTKNFDIIIIGGGPGGLAAAIEAQKCGKKVLLIEREARLGGILKQCIHDGFGVVRFGEKLTGPEYAERFVKEVQNAQNIEVALFSFVTKVEKPNNFVVTFVSREGVSTATADKLILACGCRERTRNRIGIHGDRGAGVFTAGNAQAMVNILGLMPTKKCVILGSGDIGLIMARRITLEGGKVLGVYEAKSTPSGLSRNLHQCLNDFDIPLHLSTTVTRVVGDNRLEGVFVSKVDQNFTPVGEQTYVPCDTLILAVGLIPENEIAAKLNVPICNLTNGAYVDQTFETFVDGVYSCGNAVHVNDLADYVSESGEIAGKYASMPQQPRTLVNIEIDKNILYAVPQRLNINSQTDKVVAYFRSKYECQNKRLVVKADGVEIFKKKYFQLLPPEMERVVLDFSKVTLTNISSVTMCLED